MKNLLLILTTSMLLFTSCSKRDYVTENLDGYEFMRYRDKGIVAYVDYFTGNYIVDTYQGFSVIESWSGVTPRAYDDLYGYFSHRGLQTIYSRPGDYFTQGRVVDSWLSWGDAMYVLEELSYGGY